MVNKRMGKSFFGVILLGLLMILSASVILAEDSAEVVVGVEKGESALDFTLVNLKGEEVTLGSLLGKKVFVDFGATWCPPCRAQKPTLQLIEEHYPEVVVLWVNLMEEKEHVVAYMEENAYSFTVLLDSDGTIGRSYAVRSIPTNVFINEEGVIVDRTVGAATLELVQEIFSLEPLEEAEAEDN